MAAVAPTSPVIFGSRLLQQLLRRGEENVLVSPASVGLALGMAAAGARGKTLAAIEQTLGVDASLALSRAKRLFATFERLPAGVAVEIANSLWVRSDLPLASHYTEALREGYRAQARSLDFASPGARDVVNDWVARATHGKITSAVDEIAPSTILALVNATYFKGLWEDSFEPDEGLDSEFVTGSGRAIGVRLMQRSAVFEYVGGSDLQALRLPYRHDRFGLLVVLPRKPLTPAAFHDIAAPGSLVRILAELKPERGTLRLPRVELDYAVDLMPELMEMGMEQAFSADADFSGMFAGRTRASISKASHKTMFAIDEKGTTAAASTVFNVMLGLDPGAPPPPFDMTVDRPFLVAVIERETDLNLFLGVIGNPSN